MSPEEMFARKIPSPHLVYATHQRGEADCYVHVDGTVGRIDLMQALNMMEVLIRFIRDQSR